jgi:hypothetical protein
MSSGEPELDFILGTPKASSNPPCTSRRGVSIDVLKFIIYVGVPIGENIVNWKPSTKPVILHRSSNPHDKARSLKPYSREAIR